MRLARYIYRRFFAAVLLCGIYTANGEAQPTQAPANPETVCEVTWQNFFPMPTAEQQYGPGVYEEYSIEYCEYWYGKRFTLWRRIYREVNEGRNLVQHDIVSKHMIPEAGRTVYPFVRGEAPPTPPSDHEDVYPGER